MKNAPFLFFFISLTTLFAQVLPNNGLRATLRSSHLEDMSISFYEVKNNPDKYFSISIEKVKYLVKVEYQEILKNNITLYYGTALNSRGNFKVQKYFRLKIDKSSSKKIMAALYINDELIRDAVEMRNLYGPF